MLIEETERQKEGKVIHHVDFNKNNNNPENLKVMGWEDHAKLHLSLMKHMRVYQGTKKQSEDSRRAILKQYQDNPDWNKGAHSKGGKQAWLNAQNDSEKYKALQKGLEIGRNDPEIRKKAGESIKQFYTNNPEKRKEHSDRIKNNWKNVSEETKERFKDKGIFLGSNSAKYKIILWAKELLSEVSEISKPLWEEKRKNSGLHNFCKFETIFNYFSSTDDLKLAAENYNHKIVKIEKVEEKFDTYCLEVEKYHNFGLRAGVFVHNCVGQGTTGTIHFGRIKQKLPDFGNPSRLMSYYLAREIEGTVDEDSGAQIRDGIKGAATYGLCPETEWPYDVERFAQKPTDKCYKEAIKNRAVNYYRVDQTLDAMKTCLAEGFPIIFGCSVFESFESEEVSRTGIVPMPGKRDSEIGGHCMVIVGYDDSTKMWKVRNSWGEGWGKGGYCFMPYDYLTDSDLASDFWTVRLVSTDVPGPIPTPEPKPAPVKHWWDFIVFW